MNNKINARLTTANVSYITRTMTLLGRWGKILTKAPWKKTEQFNPPEIWCSCQQDTPLRISVSQIDRAPDLHEPQCHALRVAVVQLRVQEIVFAPPRAISMGQLVFAHFLLFLQAPASAPAEALQLFHETGVALEEALRLASEFCMDPEAGDVLREFETMYKALEKTLKKRGVN